MKKPPYEIRDNAASDSVAEGRDSLPGPAPDSPPQKSSAGGADAERQEFERLTNMTIAHLEAEIERLREAMARLTSPGIERAPWFYAPCPKCGAIEGMGLTTPRIEGVLMREKGQSSLPVPAPGSPAQTPLPGGADTELIRMAAEKVMGWRFPPAHSANLKRGAFLLFPNGEAINYVTNLMWNPRTSIADAFILVDILSDRFVFSMAASTVPVGLWTVAWRARGEDHNEPAERYGSCTDPDLCRAILLACLCAVDSAPPTGKGATP